MKRLIYFLSFGFILLTACSKSAMDKVNQDVNDATNMPASGVLPAVIVESSFGTTGTDLAWYASVYSEQSTGTSGQMYDADRRNSPKASSTYNNAWNSVYNNLANLKDIITKCSPNGSEPNNNITLGIAQVLTAYNIAVITDMFGQAPFTQALQPTTFPQPKYDKQQAIYQNIIFAYLNNAIANFAKAPTSGDAATLAKQDLIYGGDRIKWTKAAWSLKARYFMRMQKVVPTAIDSVLACIPNGFTSVDDALVFNKYNTSAAGTNPWYQFFKARNYLSVGQTLYSLMKDRTDPRIASYFTLVSGAVFPAPNGAADQVQNKYSYSAISQNSTAATPLMSYHELLFLQAEALARKGQDYTAVLQNAIKANFAFHGVAYDPNYYTNQVLPRLNISALNEIITQKYIGEYEAESIEAYNDYRRTRIPAMTNPYNTMTGYGFPERYAYPVSETNNNGANVPAIDIYSAKVWWAGGTE